ncbi:hypothetical protein [Natrononativus amylolyticus]|uniref:hypothetical protein n=1 Tax=Natrononativus amylolyticus TaxID=2963434 RepID=UPI0020CD7F55|nr:hypothetical protein [Natrononativus amylolyticus]
MNRRQYLASLSVLGTGALAGCLDDLSGLRDASSVGTQREPTVEMTRSYREADRDRRRAVGQLNRAALALRPLATELEDTGNVSVEFDEPRDRLADARTHLEDAEATDEGTAAAVAALRSFADVLAGVVETTAAVTDDAIPDAIDALSEEIDARRLEAAETTVAGLRARFATARDELDPALETLPELDRDRLEGLAVVDLEPIEEGLRLLDEVVVGLSNLGAALAATVDGHRCLERGEEQTEAERYDEAAASFDEAAAHYEAATAHSDDALDAPGGVGTYAETTRCQSVHLEEAALEFADSARALDERDPTGAARHEEAGAAALEAADDCV